MEDDPRAAFDGPSGRHDRTLKPYRGRMPLATSVMPDEIVAASPAMRRVMARVERIGPKKLPVLITGETGTGKEVVARALHLSSQRASRSFVVLNGGAIAEGLADSEMFGHCRGAFTGAHSDRKGLIEEAHGGTLFIDEVGELSPALQLRLLRFVDTGEIRRVGDNHMSYVDARIVAATNRDMEREVEERRFRKDLYFRLKAAAIHIPPLQERREDIDALVDRWLPILARDLAPAVRGLSPAARRCLRAYPWPGNVRELRHVLELALTMADGELIDDEALGPDFGSVRVQKARTAGAPVERERVLTALQQHRWNVSRAAESLGINRKTLWRWRHRLGVD